MPTSEEENLNLCLAKAIIHQNLSVIKQILEKDKSCVYQTDESNQNPIVLASSKKHFNEEIFYCLINAAADFDNSKLIYFMKDALNLVYHENNFDALDVILASLKKYSESDLEERQILVNILSKAIINQNFEMTKKFVKTNKYCVYDNDENDNNPLVLASSKENFNKDIFSYLINIDVDRSRLIEIIKDVLYLAYKENSIEDYIFKMIFENLNKLNLVDEDLKVILGDVLTMACSRRSKSVILKILIKFDQIYLIKHLHDFISIACRYGYLDSLEVLVNKTSTITAKQSVINELVNKNKFYFHLAAENGHIEVLNYFLELGVDIKAKDNKNLTAFDYATKNNHNEALKFLLKKFEKEHRTETSKFINSINPDGDSLIRIAINNSNFIIAKALVDYGADLNIVAEDGDSMIINAIKNQNIDAFNFLVENNADLNKKTKNGQSLLHIASSCGNEEISKILIERGLNIQASDVHEDTPLHSACRFNKSKMVEFLIEHGANIESQNDDLRTPLHQAVWKGYIQIVHILTKYGSNLEAKDKHDRTPLHLAYERGYQEVIEFLIQNGANQNSEDSYGYTPIDLTILLNLKHLDESNPIKASTESSEYPLHEACQKGDIEEILSLLNDHDLYEKNSNDETPLHVAVKQNLKIFEILFNKIETKKRKMILESKTIDQRTCLHQACRLGSFDISQFLIKNGANKEAEDKNLRRPLHLAAEANSVEIINLLIENNAVIDCIDLHKLTPLDLAKQFKKTEAIEALENFKNKKIKSEMTLQISIDKIDLLVPSQVFEKKINFKISESANQFECPFVVKNRLSSLYELEPHSIKFDSPVILKFKNIDYENKNICLLKQENDENLRILNKWSIYYPSKKNNREVEFELTSFSFVFLGEIDIKIKVNVLPQILTEELHLLDQYQYIQPGLSFQTQCRCSNESRILNQYYGEFKLIKDSIDKFLKYCEICKTIESFKSIFLFQAEAKIEFKLKRENKSVKFDEAIENNLIVFGSQKSTEFDFINIYVYKNLLKFNNTYVVVKIRNNLREEQFPEATIKTNDRFIYKSFEPNASYVIKQTLSRSEFPFGTEQLSHVFEYKPRSITLGEKINLNFKIQESENEEFLILLDELQNDINLNQRRMYKKRILYKQEICEVDKLLNYWTGHLPIKSNDNSIKFLGLPYSDKNHQLYLSTLDTYEIFIPGLKYLINCDFTQCNKNRELMIINRDVFTTEIKPFVDIANGSLKCLDCNNTIDNSECIKAFILYAVEGTIIFRIYENQDNQTVYRDFEKKVEVKKNEWIHFTNPNRQLTFLNFRKI